MPSFFRQIDVDDKGSLDKQQVIAALQQSGEADYDSVCFPPAQTRVILSSTMM